MKSTTFDLVSGSPDERFDEFERFIEHWLGTRKVDYGVPADVLAALELPKPLRRFYAFLGNWPESPMCTQNVLRPAETLANQKGAAVGLVEFAVENQGVYRWATVAEGDDPPVYFAEHWDDLPADAPFGDYPAPGWYDWDPSLTNFLIDYALTELALAPIPSVGIAWSSSLEHYVESSGAHVVVLRRSAAGNPLSILVDGNYLLDGREHDRWRFCAARSADSAAALERFDGELDRLFFNFGKSLPLGERTSRDWSIEVWATGAARVRHHPIDEWLPPKTVDVDALVALLHYGEKASDTRVRATIKKLGVGDTNASISVTSAAKLFDSIIEAIPAKRSPISSAWMHREKAFAGKHPPAVLRREPGEIDASADPAPWLGSVPLSTVPDSTVLALMAPASKTASQSDEGDSLVVQLDEWILSVRADGSGAIRWKQFDAPFGVGSISMAESAAKLRSGNVTVEHPPINVPSLIESLQSFLEIKPDLSFRKNIEYLVEFDERAVRRNFKAAVRISDATPSTHAVDPLVVETIWNQALDAIGRLPVVLQRAVEATPPDFAKAAEFGHSFSVEHPDVLKARDAAKL